MHCAPRVTPVQGSEWFGRTPAAKHITRAEPPCCTCAADASVRRSVVASTCVRVAMKAGTQINSEFAYCRTPSTAKADLQPARPRNLLLHHLKAQLGRRFQPCHANASSARHQSKLAKRRVTCRSRVCVCCGHVAGQRINSQDVAQVPRGTVRRFGDAHQEGLAPQELLARFRRHLLLPQLHEWTPVAAVVWPSLADHRPTWRAWPQPSHPSSRGGL